MAKLEYRVRWRREGGSTRTAIFQTAAAAMRKADGILAVERLRDDEGVTRFRGMEPLSEGPEIQVREVGAWEMNTTLRAPQASDLLVRSMADYYYSLEPERGNYGDSGDYDDAMGF